MDRSFCAYKAARKARAAEMVRGGDVRRRGVGDAAPYGRQRNRACSVQRNGCEKLYLTAPLKSTLSRTP